ncbi:MAG: 23S rRNA (uracil(1939)-C(5))-methyltransferase RlmD [Lachnospiraceae bacterium]|nr:23S rRNA (uracil(1939)-C(5))-methyltransferase RlmD [Lachnospiraceae bacterium]
MEYKKNDCLTVQIEDMGNEGEGIGRVDGFILFVKDAVIGDTVRVKIMKAKKNYAYAHLEEILEPSPYRQTPRCPVCRQCGGCQLQALSYEKQLEYKQNKIRGSLIRLGGFAEDTVDAVMEPILGMNGEGEEPFHYRNKAQYPVGRNRAGDIITGFYAAHSHSIVPNTDCALGAGENRKILEEVLAYMKENRVSAYDEESGKGIVRHILIRKGFASGEIMVCLVINRKQVQDGKWLPAQEDLIRRLRAVFGMASISVSCNTERNNVIMGNCAYTLWGKEQISDTIRMRDMRKTGFPFTGDKLHFGISPLSFYQVNPLQTEKLYSTALEYADLHGTESVWDLYCGIGTISLFMAKRAGRVYGVEIVPEAIADAGRNAQENGIHNAAFFVGKAEEVLPAFYEKQSVAYAGAAQKGGRHLSQEEALPGITGEGGWQSDMLHPDVIVVDPPRKGCDSACLDTILKMQPSRVVYVSCDPATLARDLKILCAGGYVLKRVRGCDMFPQSGHVETVCLLSNRKPDARVKIDVDLEDYYRIKDEQKKNKASE